MSSLNQANNLQVKLSCCQPRLWRPNFISKIKNKTLFWTFVPHDQEWIWYLIRPFILWKKILEFVESRRWQGVTMLPTISFHCTLLRKKSQLYIKLGYHDAFLTWMTMCLMTNV